MENFHYFTLRWYGLVDADADDGDDAAGDGSDDDGDDTDDANSDVSDVGWRGWPQFAHGQPLPAQKPGMGADTDFDGFGRFDESPARSDDDILL